MTEAAQSRPRPKLPVQQLAILVVARLAEPLAYTSIYPYLPEMIRDFGVPQEEVAKWAGMTTAIFAVSQGLAALPWGRASDRYGRKPILLCGLMSTMVCFLVWGVSTSLPMAMAARAIQGAGNGNVAIIRTIVAEIVPEKELRPRAFSIMPLVWSLGAVLGPAFGGFLAQPARQYPDLFGHIDFFKRFPYALPNLVATVFFLTSATTAFLFLKESLPAKRDQRDWGLVLGSRLTRAVRRKPPRPHLGPGSCADDEATTPDQSPKKPAPPSTSPNMREALTRQTVINLGTYTILSLHSVAFDQNMTVFLNYPVMEHTPENTRLPFYFNGGFGLESSKIGSIFAIYGITCGVIQFLLYPSLVKRFGVLRCWHVCSVVIPFVYMITPYTSLFPTEGTRLAAVIIVLMIKGFVTIVAFPCITILLTNSCASTHVLGTVNGLGTSFSGFARAIGPASTGLAFSWGARHGYMVSAYFFLALASAAGAVPGFFIRDGDGPTISADPCPDDAAAAESLRYGSSDGVLPSAPAVPDVSDDEADAAAPLLSRRNKQGVSYNATDIQPK
ncbi:major facilitator superfamily protein [Hirsutella rhossiliensis]|uniref:Major facilitator superfamily domain-containing protein n=1 Tax=Hirsutella rhossiliensis TaxID=111463 RepID=A0A9P8MRE1_9HYPO|nr:major facilitator superfamily domain-containing protein [Hirsutella rhossiliensis]KAH0957837.1 major facilitator superfamily domain-containing protein [Hirsutella rhossiliensis]